MRTALGVGGVALLLAGALHAKDSPTPAAAQQPVFRGGVDLVTLDVRVVDTEGRPVPGLTAGDFTVTLDGRPRAVRAVDYLTFGSTTTHDAAAPAPGPAGAVAPHTPASRGGRVILFLVDDVSARPLEIVSLAVAAQRMLPTFDSADLVGLMTTSGLGGFVSPTRDRAAVSAALHGKGIVGRADVRVTAPFVTVDEGIAIAQDIDQSVFSDVVNRECQGGNSTGRSANVGNDTCSARVRSTAREVDAMAAQQRDQQLEAYAHAIAALQAEPSPRVIIALTKGFALSPYVPSPLDAVSHAAADADVGFYALVPIDESGVDLSDPGPVGQLRARARTQESVFLVDGTHALATAAGGDAFAVVGQADRFLHQIDAETSALYRLGIEAPPGSDPNRYLAVKVTVNRPGLTVRANVHALRPAATTTAPGATVAPASVADAMKQRLDQGGAAYGVPIRLAIATRKDPASARAEMLVTVEAPVATPGPLKTMFAVLNGAGGVVQSGRADVAGPPGDDYRLTLPVPLEEGEYRLRVVAADANGNIGSVDQPAPLHLRRLGPLTASDLLLSASTSDTAPPHLLTLDTLPPKAAILQATLELYGADPPPGLAVHMTVTPERGGAAIADVDLTPAPRGGAWVASSSMPVDDLGEGRYIVTATVTAGGQTLGTVTGAVKKSEK